MKNLIFILLMTIASQCVYCQNEVVSSEYDRPSITFIYLDRNFDQLNDKFKNAFLEINTGEKYFKNDLEFYGVSIDLPADKIDVATERQKYGSIEKSGVLQKIILGKTVMLNPTDSFGIRLGEALNEKFNIGGKATAIWAEKDTEGEFVVLNQRSSYNLNANDIRDNLDYKKLENFKNLFFKNYLLVYEIGEWSSPL